MSWAKPNYGSVETSDDTEQQGTSFQESNVYYLPEKVLTAEEKRQKCVLVAVPLLAALIIVGGAAYFLFRDFDSLYPSPGQGGREPYFSPTHSAPTEPAVTPVHIPYGPPIASPTSNPPTSSSKSSSNADCSAHPKCNDLGLTGVCCPSQDGVFLGCC